MIRVTADSNIHISALQFGGKPLRLLEQAIRGEIEIAISPAILAETLRVLRDKFQLAPEELGEAERYIRICAKAVEPTETIDAVAAGGVRPDASVERARAGRAAGRRDLRHVPGRARAGRAVPEPPVALSACCNWPSR